MVVRGIVRVYLASLEDLILKVTGASSAGASSAMLRLEEGGGCPRYGKSECSSGGGDGVGDGTDEKRVSTWQYQCRLGQVSDNEGVVGGLRLNGMTWVDCSSEHGRDVANRTLKSK